MFKLRKTLLPVIGLLLIGVATTCVSNHAQAQINKNKAPLNSVVHLYSNNQVKTSAPSVPNNAVTLVGAGAPFPAQLYQTWFQEFNKQYPNVQVNYQLIGSDAGVKWFIKGTVDFGASDDAMTDKQIALVKRGVMTLPLTGRALTIAYNLPGVKNLKLPRQVYTNIFLGKIKYWNDPAIIKANKGTRLPRLPITVVYRADGSNTTQIFTRHLSAISREWRSKVGSGKSVKWVTGVGAS
ncbi:hypothetical protein DSM106972_094570 [Dulcicalothrix desertica PCC 7102]|uniref:PBP domain-containing protein n=1 Tax=Dulcicalothrix desertica PCC 7102 TaxID=232991 RepID=A0A433UJF2_9CYAN|nr:phosphate ABC transporter substrate-binding protein PstS [Dulcicalothrix desertica]RUS93986.1 hypothetical protein DSM106972_094570 [Dulcicalothrix desertica PCC 7102]